MTIEQKAKAYDEALRMIKKELQKCGYTGCDTARQIFRYFPELEDEDEKIRKGIIHNLKYLANKAQGFVKDELEERIAWLEKQVPVDEEKVLIGARKDVALSIMNFFNKNTLGICLSNMECEDLEDAVVNSDWLKVYRYMKKKLEKQDKQKEINLVEILKHYPKETELYSPLYGKLWLAEVDEKSEIITCYKHHLEEGCTRAILPQEDTVSFYSNGTTGLPDYTVSKDCMLFLYNIEKQDEQKQDPCENCKDICLNCQNFPCIEKRAFEQGKSILEVINEEKVESKFHEGDWVVSPNGVYWHIDRIENNRYEVTSDTGKCADWPLDTNLYRLWTIQDANKGDVLACDKCILIFDQLSEFNNEQVLMDICHCTSKGFYWQDTKDRDVWALDGFKPATKEQCDTLFAKMNEAGFEWDAEKKELKIIDWIKHIKYEPNSPSIIEENPAWSDEDEETILKMMFTFRTRVFPSSEECISFIDFLKSLKDKVQPKQEWSEKDEKTLAKACIMLDWYKGNNWWSAQYIKDWLKALKGRVGCEANCTTTKEWGN